MVESKSVDQVHSSLLSGIDDSYEKSEGYLVYDLLRSIAIEDSSMSEEMVLIKDKIDVDKLVGDELKRFVKQRKGIEYKEATYAIGTLPVVGDGTVSIDDLFETPGGIQFKSTETKIIIGSGTVAIKAVLPGIIGNVPTNQITQIPVTIAGIISVNNDAATYDGFEEESNNSIRERYYEALRTPATSGNKYHYLIWTKSVSGVGQAKVFPLERGDNTVEVVIVNSDIQPASQEIVDAAQVFIDPNSEGKGEGEAPIGAHCYVISATALQINISVNITPKDGYTNPQLETIIGTNTTSHLKEYSLEDVYISYAKIGKLIIESEGVEDYANLTVNGGAGNVPIDLKEVAVLGGVALV